MKKIRQQDKIIYFGVAALICFSIFVFQYLQTKNDCPRSGNLLYIAGALSLTTFLVGKNISRMTKKGIPGRYVALQNIGLVIAAVLVCFFIYFGLFFCLEF